MPIWSLSNGQSSSMNPLWWHGWESPHDSERGPAHDFGERRRTRVRRGGPRNRAPRLFPRCSIRVGREPSVRPLRADGSLSDESQHGEGRHGRRRHEHVDSPSRRRRVHRRFVSPGRPTISPSSSTCRSIAGRPVSSACEASLALSKNTVEDLLRRFGQPNAGADGSQNGLRSGGSTVWIDHTCGLVITAFRPVASWWAAEGGARSTSRDLRSAPRADSPAQSKLTCASERDRGRASERRAAAGAAGPDRASLHTHRPMVCWRTISRCRSLIRLRRLPPRKRLNQLLLVDSGTTPNGGFPRERPLIPAAENGMPTAMPTPVADGKPIAMPTPAADGKPIAMPTPAERGKPIAMPHHRPSARKAHRAMSTPAKNGKARRDVHTSRSASPTSSRCIPHGHNGWA